jgi:nicotinate-nucleotide pyrophosphorylase (carboxylating)
MDHSKHHVIHRFVPAGTRTLLRLALDEDLGQGDVLGEALQRGLPDYASHTIPFHIVPRKACIVSGHSAVLALIQESGFSIQYTPFINSGSTCAAYSPIAELSGPLSDILALERTLLNVLQRCCGIATHTRAYVEALEGTGVKLAHTRKTTPGWRWLEQQAVLDGGGAAHRYNLSHTAMVKDNLLASLPADALPVLAQALRERLPHTARLEIECDTLEQIEPALATGAHVLLLDNMSPADVKTAVQMVQGRAVIEVSGGITLETIREKALPGVAVISTSQITLGAPPIDIGLDAVSTTSIKQTATHS